MKKSIFLFFAAILCAMSTQGAPDLYVRGARNSWGAGVGDKMTEETTGSKWTYTSYWDTRSDFKIATNDWKNYNFGSANIQNFGTDYTLTNDGSSGNMKFPSSMSTNGGLYKITVTKSGSSYKIKVDKLVEEGTSSYNIGANTHIYFNVAAASSEYDAASILLGHTGGSQDYAMEGKIEGTELFYKKMPKWDGFKTFCFIDANNWGGNWNGERVTQRLPWATNTNKYNQSMSGGYHMFTVESGNDNANMTYTSKNSSYTDLLNKTQTIRVYVKKAGASSYTEVDNWPGSITPDYYYMSSANATTHKSGETLIANASVKVSAVLTSQFKLVESSTILGYTFDGWGTTSTGPTENGNTYTIKNISGENEIYAFFSEITHTVTITNDGNGSTVPSGEQLNITEKEGIAISAEAAENFAFTSWTIVSGTGTFDAQNSASTKFYPTSDATIKATFHSTITNSLSVVAGANVESVDGSTDPVVLGESYEIKATPAHGYKFNLWTAEPAENAAFDNASSATTQVKVLNGSVTVTASASEIMSALTTSNTYDEGTPSIDAPTTSVSEIGITTTATITAATDIDYTLASWTLENCVRTDGGADNATTITVKSNGDGAAATVTANYNLIPKITLYFVNSTQWEVVACHHWKEGVSGTIWPGDLMEKVSTVHGFDIYKVKFTELEHDQCIFNNNNNGKQTGNLAVQDGKYYYPETDEWYATVAEIPTPCTDCSNYAIAGSMNDWSARRNRLKVTANNDIVELTLELTAGDYEFKVAGPQGWFGNSGKYERKDSGNAWTYRIKDDENNDEDNARIYIDMTGEYTFTWKISTKELTITYPELPDFSQQTDIILFRPSTNWKKDDAHFAAYFFGATAEKWVDMTDADGDGIYEAANPKTNLSVKICCLKSGKTETKWENVKWRSINYEIPTRVENCWVVNDEAEDDATGIWTVLIGESDNSTTLSAANSQTVNTLVNRQFESEKLYTISLPFALDAEQVETIFGAGTTLYQFAQLAKEGEELVLYFSTPSAIAAATPYLIQPTQDVTKGFIVEDATISSTPNNISFTVDYTTITMEAILSVEANAKTDGKYWLAADKYLYNNENDLPALRALFNVSTKSGMPPRARVALGENATTDIDNITNVENTTIKLIENGQLIIIRNGEKFNAQGVRF